MPSPTNLYGLATRTFHTQTLHTNSTYKLYIQTLHTNREENIIRRRHPNSHLIFDGTQSLPVGPVKEE